MEMLSLKELLDGINCTFVGFFDGLTIQLKQIERFIMETLTMNQMEQIEGGSHDCAAEAVKVAITAGIIAATGPAGWIVAGAGIYRGHKLYHACFE